jgi:hypothetical protein
MTVTFGADLQVGGTLDGRTIASLDRTIRGEIIVRFVDGGRIRQVSDSTGCPSTRHPRRVPCSTPRRRARPRR